MGFRDIASIPADDPGTGDFVAAGDYDQLVRSSVEEESDIVGPGSQDNIPGHRQVASAVVGLGDGYIYVLGACLSRRLLLAIVLLKMVDPIPLWTVPTIPYQVPEFCPRPKSSMWLP